MELSLERAKTKISKEVEKIKKFLTNGFEHDKISKLSDENSKEP